MSKKRSDHNIVPLRRKPPAQGRNIVLGVTGGIACGKSMISRFFKEMGAAVLSADELAREVLRPGEDAFEKVVAHFGKEILAADGTIDRALLGKKIFLSPRERKELERITHPAISRLAMLRINELRLNPEFPLIIYEAPLLFEAKAENRVDLILVVAITPERQLERLMQRDSLTKEEALQRISAQMPLEEKISRADILVENNSAPEETKKLVHHIFEVLTKSQKKSPGSTGDLKRD